MEAYVVMMSGKPYNNEELTKKLVDVLKNVLNKIDVETRLRACNVCGKHFEIPG
jgi:hypothetical protein